MGMGPGGQRYNPQQQPGVFYWHQPSQADRPAVDAQGNVINPIIPPPDDNVVALRAAQAGPPQPQPQPRMGRRGQPMAPPVAPPPRY